MFITELVCPIISGRPHIQAEWEKLRKHDIGFLVTVAAATREPGKYNREVPFPTAYGILCVRGCEIEGMHDSRGRIIEEFPREALSFPTKDRTFRVLLDPNQYQTDMVSVSPMLRFCWKIKHTHIHTQVYSKSRKRKKKFLVAWVL